jgi:hypothetical protein
MFLFPFPCFRDSDFDFDFDLCFLEKVYQMKQGGCRVDDSDGEWVEVVVVLFLFPFRLF